MAGGNDQFPRKVLPVPAELRKPGLTEHPFPGQPGQLHIPRPRPKRGPSVLMTKLVEGLSKPNVTAMLTWHVAFTRGLSSLRKAI